MKLQFYFKTLVIHKVDLQWSKIQIQPTVWVNRAPIISKSAAVCYMRIYVSNLCQSPLQLLRKNLIQTRMLFLQSCLLVLGCSIDFTCHSIKYNSVQNNTLLGIAFCFRIFVSNLYQSSLHLLRKRDLSLSRFQRFSNKEH